jgi:hypothetical protein
MLEKKLTPARARALIVSALNDGYRASQVKNIDKVKAVLTPEQIQRTIDKTLQGSTIAKDAQPKPKKPKAGSTRIGTMGTGRPALGGGSGGFVFPNTANQ